MTLIRTIATSYFINICFNLILIYVLTRGPIADAAATSKPSLISNRTKEGVLGAASALATVAKSVADGKINVQAVAQLCINLMSQFPYLASTMAILYMITGGNNEESAEMKLMKEKFAEMSSRFDSIDLKFQQMNQQQQFLFKQNDYDNNVKRVIRQLTINRQTYATDIKNKAKPDQVKYDLNQWVKSCNQFDANTAANDIQIYVCAENPSQISTFVNGSIYDNGWDLSLYRKFEISVLLDVASLTTLNAACLGLNKTTNNAKTLNAAKTRMKASIEATKKCLIKGETYLRNQLQQYIEQDVRSVVLGTSGYQQAAGDKNQFLYNYLKKKYSWLQWSVSEGKTDQAYREIVILKPTKVGQYGVLKLFDDQPAKLIVAYGSSSCSVMQPFWNSIADKMNQAWQNYYDETHIPCDFAGIEECDTLQPPCEKVSQIFKEKVLTQIDQSKLVYYEMFYDSSSQGDVDLPYRNINDDCSMLTYGMTCSYSKFLFAKDYGYTIIMSSV